MSIADDQCSAPPPTDSRPEAHNFPSQIYEFNQDTSLFQAPKYPEAPKDMYYQVPSKASQMENPKPIFPWEEHAPRPTRVFPKDRSPSPEPVIEEVPQQEPEVELIKEARPLSNASESSDFTKESRSSSTSASEGDPWNSYTRQNAWDAMPEIERYVQAISQARRGKVQVIQPAAPSFEEADPSLSSRVTEKIRRPSMKITDFPTEVERPSLPVTPAPRHPSFWGEERDAVGELPAAEGVPKQEDWVSRSTSHSQPSFASAASAVSAFGSATLRLFSWRCQFCGKQNPVEKLEELQRRQSEVLQTGPELKSRELPRRAMPGSAVDPPTGAAETASKASSSRMPTTTESSASKTTTSGADHASTHAQTTVSPKSILKEPSFELGSLSNEGASSTTKDVAPEVLAPDVTTSA